MSKAVSTTGATVPAVCIAQVFVYAVVSACPHMYERLPSIGNIVFWVWKGIGKGYVVYNPALRSLPNKGEERCVCVCDRPCVFSPFFFQNERRLPYCLIDLTSIQSPCEGRRKVNVVTAHGGRHFAALHLQVNSAEAAIEPTWGSRTPGGASARGLRVPPLISSSRCAWSCRF